MISNYPNEGYRINCPYLYIPNGSSLHVAFMIYTTIIDFIRNRNPANTFLNGK